MTADTETTTTTTDEATDTEAAAEDTASEATDADTTPPAPNVAAMERALKKANKEAETARRKLKEREDADLSDQEKALDAARREGETQATTAANARILRAEVRVAAAMKLHDPADALAYLDLTEFTVGDDGEVDAAAIAAAIDTLLTEKPYLAKGATPGSTQVPTGAAGRTGTTPTLDEQIAAAQKAGDNKAFIRLQNQKLAATASPSVHT